MGIKRRFRFKALAKDWHQFVVEGFPPGHKASIDWSVHSIGKELLYVQVETKIGGEALRAIFDFISSDNFWRFTTRTPYSLLNKNGDGIRKIDSILVKMGPKSISDKEIKHNFYTDNEDEAAKEVEFLKEVLNYRTEEQKKWDSVFKKGGEV